MDDTLKAFFGSIQISILNIQISLEVSLISHQNFHKLFQKSLKLKNYENLIFLPKNFVKETFGNSFKKIMKIS
jgi:hypothetical protein